MFFNSIKEINRFGNKINRLLMEGILLIQLKNSLRKEIHRLFSKEMSNIYIKVTIETFSKFRLFGFKKFATRLVFGQFQLTQMSLNFKTSCCNLEIRGLGAKLCVTFLLF